jgi:hypothetical protein
MDDDPSSKRGSGSLCRLALAITLLAGIAARVAGAWWLRHSRNPDYAVVVQMARHIAEGREWPVFYHGQSYMGSLEPTASAVLVALFGPAPFWVCLGTALFGIALLFAVHRWARDVGGAWAGMLAVALVAIGPTGYLQYMASPRGGYALGLLLTVLLLREGSRLAWQARLQWNVPVGRCALLGLLGGLGFWNFWLTLPALAAAGLVLLAALRWRLLRFRVWFPGALGFAVGSLPFWIWNARHGWASFLDQQAATGRGQVLDAVRLMVTERLPILLDAVGVSRARAVAVLAAHALLLVLALGILVPRRGARRRLQTWTLAVVFAYAAFFSAAYALSSFSIPCTPRYLLPFVPVFAVLAGVAVAQSWRNVRDFGSARRACLQRVLVAGAGSLCLAGIVAFQASLLPRQRGTDGWYAAARQITDELADRGIETALADYLLYGLNWVSDERFCVSSPRLERYRPYAQRVELSPQPAVLENVFGFNHFLAATGAAAVHERIAGWRVHSAAIAPSQAVLPVPLTAIRGMQDDAGRAWLGPLTDLFASTLATLVPRSDGACALEVTFAEPVTACGVRAWVCDDGAWSWAVEGRPVGSDAFRELSPPHVATGYFWSGPRFFHGGRDRREEKRFAPLPLEAVRVRFLGRGERGVVRLSELQILQSAGEARLPDVAAVAAAVRSNGLARVYADRWLANQLHTALGGTVWTSRDGATFGDRGADEAVTVQPDTAIAAEPAAVDSVRRALRRIDVTAREQDIGGVTLFVLPDGGDSATPYRGLRFLGVTLVHAHPRALADFWLKRAGALPPPEAETALRAALATDPDHERARSALAKLLENTGRRDEATVLRRDGQRRATIDVPLDAAFFGERLMLLGLSSWPAVVHPGEVVAFEAKWRLAPGFQGPGGVGFFVHFLRGREIAFQLDVPLALQTGAFDGASDADYSTHHAVVVPAGTEPGILTPVLGLSRPGPLGRRVPVETDLPTLRRRVVVPGTIEVKE